MKILTAREALPLIAVWYQRSGKSDAMAAAQGRLGILTSMSRHRGSELWYCPAHASEEASVLVFIWQQGQRRIEQHPDCEATREYAETYRTKR